MPTRVVDAHTHLFPPDVIERRQHFIGRDRWFGHLYENPRAKLAAAVDIIESMNLAGVRLSIVCGFPWADPGLCREQNDFMAETCGLAPDRLAFLGIVVPTSADAANEAERCFAMGAVGIGELNADAQAFDLRQPMDMQGLMEICAAHEKPVMLHATEPIGHDYPGKGASTPERLVTWLTEYSRQPVVLAHWGGGLPFYELMPEVHAVTRNVVYDSAATTYLYRQQVFEQVSALAGSERVLFASDYPILRQDRLLRRVERTMGSQPGFSALVGGNADRVYGLGDMEVACR
jgi:predicted TIM-barrel fold metal-dependent hydrolase